MCGGITADWRKAESVWCSASLCPTSSDWLPLTASTAPLGIGPSHGTVDPLPGAAHPTTPLACLMSFGQHLAIRNSLILFPSCISVTADLFFSPVCHGRLDFRNAVSGDTCLSQMKEQDIVKGLSVGMVLSNLLQLK